MIKRCFFFVLVFVLLLTACAAVQPAQPAAQPQPEVPGETPWPTRDWQISTPQEQGIDPVMLDKMQAHIKSSGDNLQSVLIIRNGYIVSETYYPASQKGQKHVQYSVTKSFISTLVGIAIDQGKLKGIDQKVFDLLPSTDFANINARKQSMTLKDLLTMTSGLAWEEGDPSYTAMYRSGDWVKWVMDLPMETDPGAKFLYCSGCSHVMSGILQQATGNTEKFAKTNLLAPLGITDYRWEADARGIAIGGWGLNLTPRDMAKLGYLYLHNGSWNGKQIVSSSWVAAATRKQVTTTGEDGYGYQFWVYPHLDGYAALGKGGQIIYVNPGLNLIVVTTAEMANHDPVFDLIENYILPASE